MFCTLIKALWKQAVLMQVQLKNMYQTAEVFSLTMMCITYLIKEFIGAEDFVTIDSCPVDMIYPENSDKGIKENSVAFV